MKKISFAEYLNSKEKLREAVTRSPQRVTAYQIKSYCRLMVESNGSKQYLPLCPRQIVKVIWLYENRRKPIPIRIYFENVKSVDPDLRFYTHWSGEKLTNWLNKNSHSK